MKTKNYFLISIILISVIMLSSCSSESGRRHKSLESRKIAKRESVAVAPDTETTKIGIIQGLSYSVESNLWHLSLKGDTSSLEIDSLTAMKIIKDRSIVAVKITEKSVISPTQHFTISGGGYTLLHENEEK